MGSTRNADAGPLFPSRRVTATVPNITDGDQADLVLPADLAFAGGGVVRPVRADFVGAPLANLGITGCWVSNPTTGVVTVRLSALTGNVATADQLFLITALEG
jgi:hypothetical protein